MKNIIRAALVLPFALVSCSVEEPADTGKFIKATFTSSLAANQSPTDQVESFGQSDTVYLSLELKGRPKAGVATAKFRYFDQTIADASVDVATVNKDVVFSVGQNTFVGFNLKANSPLPVGVGYRAELSFAGKSLGDFPFKISPPKDSIPSKIISVVLAKGVDDASAPVDPTKTFSPEEKVVIAGTGNLGNASTLEAQWYVSGELNESGTRTITMKENKESVPFYFSFLPAGGWPAGEHEVRITLDGAEVAREKIAIAPTAPPETPVPAPEEAK